MKFKINDELANVLERATWTFVQAFFSVVLVTNSDTYKSAAVAGLAAAFSVVKTYVVEKAKKMSAGTEEENAS
jgi:hypothetical protein